MIWGKGVFEKEVRLSFLDEEYSTRVNKDGGWSIVLKNLKPGGPYDMVINHDNDEK